MFDSILGNQPIKTYLERVLKEGRLPQTLLFSGIDGIGKSLFAHALARELLQSNQSPDFHILKPEGKSGLYGIDTLREMIDEDHASSYAGKGKVFLLEDAHRMQPAAASALLKTLEEPSVETTFILLSSNTAEVLSTILSRSTILVFKPLKTSEIETFLQGRGLSVQFAKYAQGSIGRALTLAQHSGLEEQRTLLFELLENDFAYPEKMQKLLSLETMLEEGKEEDPVRFASQIEHIFSLILMWHRDQNLREARGKEEWLFFPDTPKKHPENLQEVERKVETVRLAISRNMKISTSFLEIFACYRNNVL